MNKKPCVGKKTPPGRFNTPFNNDVERFENTATCRKFPSTLKGALCRFGEEIKN